ncbi:semaphorin-5B isoform X3 [Electrophorus electricus]|uniref:semaphorin-5B isoform X3 n=1 Tax=Electrophorus electricus TaxID=8005 RepID=UPI0015CFA8F4|nr:semaphorin-5B isoform X3 [Electrophorus electricus]
MLCLGSLLGSDVPGPFTVLHAIAGLVLSSLQGEGVVVMVTMPVLPLPSFGSFVFVLFLVLSQTPPLPVTSDTVPSRSEHCNRKVHPVIPYTALSPWLSSFSMHGVNDYSQLTLDLSRNQLIVGARNYLFRLSLRDVSLLQGTEWGVDEETRRSCQSKGKTEEECQNYVRVLLLTGVRLFTCGTNAFSPTCTTRPLSDLAQVVHTVNGVARCPYDPRHNSTAMVTESGEFYAATVIDFSGRDPVIYRSMGSRPPLRTAQYNSRWLNEPHFISAYEVGHFTYVFLRETAVEQDCGKAVFSRVARVCQNDVGGRFLLEDTWTTFMKARLNCSRTGDAPFYYHELQSTFYLPEQDLIYGVFTTNANSIAASAICAFNLSAISQAFSGPFRYQETLRTTWLSTPNPLPNFQCATVGDGGPGGNLTERSLQDAQRLVLMSEAVQPVSTDPLVSQGGVRFSRLAVDVVQGRDTLHHVLYIGTEHGTIIKALSISNKSLRGCYLEEMNLLPEDQREPVLNLQLLQSDRSLFVGLRSRVLKVPLERCSTYESQRKCLGARDPYCGWDRKQKRCTTIEDSSNMSQWTQNITQCPEQNLTQDGNFGPWSPWQSCSHDDGGESTSACQCRARVCDNPAPRCGGAECEGPLIEVANCSRNGGWTPWSSWTACSTSCGVGFEVRQRSCNNPSPKHGGRVCVGQMREERLCNENTPCPLPVSWVSWSSWTTCTALCGGGVQSRLRSCENGNTCPGCRLEYKVCNLEACSEVRRNTPWSPWYPVNLTVAGARQEQRVRYTCRALLPDPQDLQLGRRKMETRLCPPTGGGTSCETDGKHSSLLEDLVRMRRPLTRGVGAKWLPWEPWSACSTECSRGFHTRRRSCAISDGKSLPFACSGTSVEYQDCNNEPCPVKGAWSCWSAWSECSTSCGGGHYQRSRTCSNPAPAHSGDICTGLHTEEALCNTHECEGGWGVWSKWAECEEGRQHRTRTCEINPAPCEGNATDQRVCSLSDSAVGRPGQKKDVHCGGFSLVHLGLSGVGSFLAAVVGSVLIYVVCQRVRKPRQDLSVIHPNTPNHLHHKDNSAAPKTDNYTPMEFKALNKSTFLPDESCHFFPPALQQPNVYATTYCPSTTTYCPSTTTYCPSTTTYCPSTTTYCPSTTTNYCPSTTTNYCPSPLGKYDFPMLDSACRSYMHS